VLRIRVRAKTKRDFGSRGFTAAALFTLTLFRRGKIIHGATYFRDVAGQRSPVRDVTTIVQYDTTAARSSHGAPPTTVAGLRALCPQTDVRRHIHV